MNEKNERFKEFPGSSQDAPGDPGEPQKFTKKRFFAKKELSTRDFLSIFVLKDGFHAFCMTFGCFFAKNQ